MDERSRALGCKYLWTRSNRSSVPASVGSCGEWIVDKRCYWCQAAICCDGAYCRDERFDRIVVVVRIMVMVVSVTGQRRHYLFVQCRCTVV